ncbi:MAG: CMP-NeuNAc synthetase [Parcubacteria group bacterium GW2011_GWB1_44_7]|nr:MAG: CMP-NeuNAc synthetase [Parcubacteria group bacterium GW2011_GWB1_44_7]
MIKIGHIKISEKSPTVIIAEVACEHRGSLSAAKRLIRAVKEAGADIVKFQLHVPKEEMVPGKIKFWAGPMDEVLKEVNFDKAEEHKVLKNYCKKVGIQYLCTPFCSEAADILEKVGVDGYKIGSGELTNLPMIRHIAQKKKPMIISTGMSVFKEIVDTVRVLKEEKADFVLMHCVSEYPAKYEHLSLGLIPFFKKKFNVMVGYSDHTTEIYPAVAAVVLGAKVIEKHFTLKDLRGPDSFFSLYPTQFRQMVNAIRNIEKALGKEKRVSKEEQIVRNWASHSVVAGRDIKKGDKLTLQNLMPKRPGSGIPAKFLDKKYSSKLLGKKAKRNLPKDTILKWSDAK